MNLLETSKKNVREEMTDLQILEEDIIHASDASYYNKWYTKYIQ